MSCQNPQASCCGAATRTGECIGICAVQAPCGECPGCTGVEPLPECQSGQDGECSHSLCPQARDGEPAATGRHCPLPWRRWHPAAVDPAVEAADYCAASDPLRAPMGTLHGFPIVADPAVDPGTAVVEQDGRPIARIDFPGGAQPARLPGGAH